MASPPRLVVTNDDTDVPDDVLGNYFNTTPPDKKDALSGKIFTGRKAYLRDVLLQAVELDPTQITAQNVSDLLNVLQVAGYSQSYLSEVFQTSKTTIARWLRMENPPRPNLRRTIVEECLRLLQQAVRLAKA